MSHKNSKRISLRQTSINKSKEALKPKNFGTEIEIRGQINLPFLKERKYTSSKNLVVSSTCQIQSLHQDNRRSNISRFKKTLGDGKQEALLSTQNDPTRLKYFFQRRKIVIKPLDMKQMRKHSSWNKLTFLPSIFNFGLQNSQSFIQNQHQDQQPPTQPTNQIQLQTIQQVKKDRASRITLRKLLKCQVNKATNVTKETENSLEVEKQNEVQNDDEKLLATKKRSSKQSNKCHLDKSTSSRVRILVKNPFPNKPLKNPNNLAQKLTTLSNLDSLDHPSLLLSQIIQDQHDQIQLSVSGKNDLESLINLMNDG